MPSSCSRAAGPSGSWSRSSRPPPSLVGVSLWRRKVGLERRSQLLALGAIADGADRRVARARVAARARHADAAAARELGRGARSTRRAACCTATSEHVAAAASRRRHDRERAAGISKRSSTSICSRSRATCSSCRRSSKCRAPGPVTHIGDALLNVLRGAQSGAIAAVVLVTDGADNSADFDAAQDRGDRELRRAGPHGRRRRRDDPATISSSRTCSCRSVGLPGSTVSAQVSIRHSGATLAQLKVYDGDAILASEPIQLPSTHRRHDALGRHRRRQGRRARSEVRARRAARRDQHHQQLAPAADGSAGAAPAHLIYRGRAALGVQVHPPRASTKGPAVRVASLLKTTPNKFYRQGVESPDELTDGFPTDELKLFALRRADDRQLRGGRAHARAARHDPRVREPARRQLADARRPARPRRRRLGRDERRRGAARASCRSSTARASCASRPRPCSRRARPHVRDDAARRERRSERGSRGRSCPSSRTSSTLGDLKPGAETLLEARDQRPQRAAARARSATASATRTCSRRGGTWRWQMQLPHEDQRHETFWRQLLQALATTRAASRHADVGASVLRRRERQ